MKITVKLWFSWLHLVNHWFWSKNLPSVIMIVKSKFLLQYIRRTNIIHCHWKIKAITSQQHRNLLNFHYSSKYSFWRDGFAGTQMQQVPTCCVSENGRRDVVGAQYIRESITQRVRRSRPPTYDIPRRPGFFFHWPEVRSRGFPRRRQRRLYTCNTSNRRRCYTPLKRGGKRERESCTDADGDNDTCRFARLSCRIIAMGKGFSGKYGSSDIRQLWETNIPRLAGGLGWLDRLTLLAV